MNRFAFYHDHDELKCEVIREAIKARAVTDGEVVCGDIKQLAANDVRGFRRAHFFCGGGFWDLALNLAGWGDDPVWTGSCPCPSFSAAGKGAGFDDPRHLWPDWFRLIRECRPPVVFGEQVGAAIRFGWFDLVQSGMEAAAYAVGKIVFGAHSVGAPHIRQRLYFVADAGCSSRSAEHQHEPWGAPWGNEAATDGAGAGPRRDAGDGEHATGDGRFERWPEPGGRGFTCGRGPGECADTATLRREPFAARLHAGSDGAGVGSPQSFAEPCHDQPDSRFRPDLLRAWRGPGWLDPQQARSVAEAGATRGFWADCDWWYGRDGKYRPVGTGLQPLAHGSPARVGRLRLYGDAIVVAQAQAFIEAYRSLKEESYAHPDR